MTVTLKTPEDIAKMRIAGKLAARRYHRRAGPHLP